MAVSLDQLPANVLKELVASILRSAPGQRLTLISSLDSRVRDTTLSMVMAHVEMPDDARLLDATKGHLLPNAGCVSALLINPARYGIYVTSLHVIDPLSFANLDEPPATLLNFEGDETFAPTGGISPMPATQLYEILAYCTNLERFQWTSNSPPPDGICEVILNHCPKLAVFEFVPEYPVTSVSPAARQALPRWDAPSVSQLATLPLTSLHVHRLSQAGARSISMMLSKMTEYSNLEDVSLDFIWLDDSLCESLVKAGRKMKRLRLGSSGTKLTDKGIVTILEGCDKLEELSLHEVQGRLSKLLWSKVTDLPISFKALRIITSEQGPHHSWTVDHLLSIPTMPLDSTETLSITRSVQPFGVEVDDVAVPRPVPREIIDKLKEDSASSITNLEVDWWAWSPADLKELLSKNQQLETLHITLDAPITKMFTLSSSFASMHNLRRLKVSIPAEHAPGTPNTANNRRNPHYPQSPTQQLTGLITPGSSPSIRGVSRKSFSSTSPSFRTSTLPAVAEATPFQTPPSTPSDALSTLSKSLPPLSPLTTISLSEADAPIVHLALPASSPISDPSFPNMREVQKFARRCPKLETLEWCGRNGRGTWSVLRECGGSAVPSTTANATAGPSGLSTSSSTVKLEHRPPCFPSPEILRCAAREKEAEIWGWTPTVPRVGQEWTGTAADAWRQMLDKERDEATAAAAALLAAEHSASAAIAGGAARANATSHRKKPSVLKLETSTASALGSSPSSRRRASQSGAAPVPASSPTKVASTNINQERKRGDSGGSNTGGLGRSRRAGAGHTASDNINDRAISTTGTAAPSLASRRRPPGANGKSDIVLNGTGALKKSSRPAPNQSASKLSQTNPSNQSRSSKAQSASATNSSSSLGRPISRHPGKASPT